MKHREKLLPAGITVLNYLPADYIDCFSYNATNIKDFKSTDIMEAFWTLQPKWIQFLFSVRNLIVKPLGLNTGEDNEKELKMSIKERASNNLMSFPYVSDEETIAYLTDKHLDAYISVVVHNHTANNKVITAVTLVRYHNFLGKAYFFVIKPFHAIIVKRQLKYIVNKFMQEN